MKTLLLKSAKPILIGTILGLAVVTGTDAQAYVYFSKPGFYCTSHHCYYYRHIWRCNHGFCTSQTHFYPHRQNWYRYY
jgi:hypothetical protein